MNTRKNNPVATLLSFIEKIYECRDEQNFNKDSLLILVLLEIMPDQHLFEFAPEDDLGDFTEALRP